MSMIDCKVNIERKPDPKGDRVLLTFECVLLNQRVKQNLIWTHHALVGSSCRTLNGEGVIL